MNKYLIRGLVVGGVFAATITGVATFDTIAAYPQDFASVG